MVLKIEGGKSIRESLEGRGVYSLTTTDDAQHARKVEPGHVSIGGFACGQVEGEVGRARPCRTVARQRLYPPDRPLQERNRTGQLGAKAGENRGDDPGDRDP